MPGGSIEVQGVSVRFGGVQALRALDATIREGEIFGISGPNGAGKTTLFNAISGHVKPMAGSIRFAGRNLVGVSPDAIYRAGIARTFQLPELVDSCSVEANIALGAHFARDRGLRSALSFNGDVGDRVEEAMAFFGLRDIRAKVTRFTTLYEKKLVMLASAVAARPSVLLLDEPAGGLVDQEIDAISAFIRALNQEGMTIVLIEHVMRVLMELSHRVLVLNQGEWLFEGSPGEVRQNAAVRRLYFGEA
jgi:ABC-type branched-subunit amino acid transport system ATPase component